jgi:hypothetical protein
LSPCTPLPNIAFNFRLIDFAGMLEAGSVYGKSSCAVVLNPINTRNAGKNLFILNFITPGVL